MKRMSKQMAFWLTTIVGCHGDLEHGELSLDQPGQLTLLGNQVVTCVTWVVQLDRRRAHKERLAGQRSTHTCVSDPEIHDFNVVFVWSTASVFF